MIDRPQLKPMSSWKILRIASKKSISGWMTGTLAKST